MIIKHIRLANWRNFAHLDLPLLDRMFVIGPNAAGKSNLLDAFRFLRDIARGSGGGLQKAIADRGGLSMIRCFAARRFPVVELDVVLAAGNGNSDTTRYSLALTQETSGRRRPLVKHEKVWRNGSLILERPDREDHEDSERLTETHLEQTTANRHFRDVAQFLNAMCYLHLVPQLLRFPESFAGPGLPEDPFGRTFLERLANTSAKARRGRLKRIEKALGVIAPNLRELAFMTDVKGSPHLTALYHHWRPDAGRQDEKQFSDGTLRAIGLFWSLMESNSLLLLEEPELSLNTEIVKELPALISGMLRAARRQVIMSTHSFDLLSDAGIDAAETVVLQPGGEGSTAKLLAQDPLAVRQLKSGMTVAEVALPLVSPKEPVQMALALRQ